jgi:hypothetical protein
MNKRQSPFPGSISFRSLLLLTGAGVCLIYLLPFLISGGAVCLPVFDDLDDCLVKYKVLSASHQLFASSKSIVEPFMNGLPRSSFPSELNLVTILFAVFPPLLAYAINQTLIHGIAFFSMAYFLKKQVNGSESVPVLLVVVSAGFAFLPFYPYAGIAVAGLPLLLNAFVNSYRKIALKADWMVIAFFPFYSSLYYQGVFVVFLLLVFCCVFARRINRYFLLAVLVFAASSVLSEYRMFIQVLFSEGSMQRQEFKPWLLMNYFRGWANVRSVVRLMVLGERNAIYSAHPFPLLILCFLLSGIGFWIKKNFQALRILAWGLVCIFIIVTLSVLNFSAVLIPLRERYPMLNIIQFDRFYNLLPPLYYLLFFYCCLQVCRQWKGMVWFLSLAAFAQVIFLFNFNYSLRELVKREFHLGKPGISYSEYYSPSLFQTIRQSIGTEPKNYKVLCIGLNPAIPLWNGFYSIDGHISDYPLSYKKQFRRLIEKELLKDKSLAGYFDHYGSRCYAFSSELELLKDYTKYDRKAINHLELNTSCFREYPNLFVFSGVEILNAEESKLLFLKKFEDPSSPWSVYVYKAIEHTEERSFAKLE